jgi:hypothetical protein
MKKIRIIASSIVIMFIFTGTLFVVINPSLFVDHHKWSTKDEQQIKEFLGEKGFKNVEIISVDILVGMAATNYNSPRGNFVSSTFQYTVKATNPSGKEVTLIVLSDPISGRPILSSR